MKTAVDERRVPGGGVLLIVEIDFGHVEVLTPIILLVVTEHEVKS